MKRTSIIAGLAGVLLGALSWAAPAAAQSVSLPAVQLPVTSSSVRVALPSTNLQQYPVVLLVPDPATTSPVFFSQGDVTSTASLTTSPVVPGGGICVAASSARTYVAAISASSTTLYVTQMTSCPQFSRGPGSGGGGGAVSSVFGRTGNVVAATNDYNFNQLAGNYTLAQGPTIGAGTVLGSVAGGTPQALTQTQLTALVNTATASLPGAVPAWPNNTTTYFRGDGTYATLNQAAVAGLTTASSPAFAGVTLGAGSAITGSGPGGALTAVAYSSFGTASGNAAQGGVITAGGPTGSATVAPIITYNAAGQLTAVTPATITPAVGSITGLGSNVAAALGNTAGGAGGFALVSAANVASVSNSDGTLTISPTTGAVVASIALGHANTWSGQQTFVAPILGTPASGVATNLTGTAAGLTAGNVTTNANLTGDVTSSGNATTLVTAQTGAHTWSALQTYSAGETNSTSATSGNSAKQFTGTLLTGAGTTNTLPQFYINATGTAAPTTFLTAGTYIGVNAASAFAGRFADFHVAGGASIFSISSGGAASASGGVIVPGQVDIGFANNGLTVAALQPLSFGSSGTSTPDTFITRHGPANNQFGGLDGASPIAQLVSFQSATGTNTAAATQATMQGPLSTGTGAAGTINLSTGFAGITGGATATFTNASPTVVTVTAHGYVPGQVLQFSNAGGALPTGISAATNYYVLATALAVNTFEISLTPGGAAVNTSSTGTGTQTSTPQTTVQNPASTVATFGPSGLTGSQTIPALSLAQVWNTSGNVTGLKFNATNIASGASSLLMDLQVGGVSQLNVSSAGSLAIGFGTAAVPGLTFAGDAAGWYRNASNQWTWESAASSAQLSLLGSLVRLASTVTMVWATSNSTTSGDTGLSRDAAGVIDVGTGTQGSKAGSMNMTNLNLIGSGQLNVAAMTQTAVAQSGTVCYNSGTGAVTYDSTVGCLTSTMTEKDNWQDITPQQALAVVLKMQAGSYTYKKGRGLPEGPQVGLSAEQIETLDDRLVGHRPNGDLAGVRYQQASALYPMAIQQLNADNDNLRAELRDLQRRVAR